MPSDITLRLSKGTELTYQEADDNFSDILSLFRANEDSPVAGGTANALTITSSNRAITTYANGMKFGFYAAATNTDSVTLNVDGQGVKSLLRPDGSALGPGDLVTGLYYEAVYISNLDDLVLTELYSRSPGVGTDLSANSNVLYSHIGSVTRIVDDITLTVPDNTLSVGSMAGYVVDGGTVTVAEGGSLELKQLPGAGGATTGNVTVTDGGYFTLWVAPNDSTCYIFGKGISV